MSWPTIDSMFAFSLLYCRSVRSFLLDSLNLMHAITLFDGARYDYGYVKDSVQGKQMLCHCKEANCRGRMY